MRDLRVPVVLSTELYGDVPAVLRRLSPGDCVVETAEPTPLGSRLAIHFRHVREGECAGEVVEIVAEAVVRSSYTLNVGVGDSAAAVRAYRLQFVRFDDSLPPERLLDRWTPDLQLH